MGDLQSARMAERRRGREESCGLERRGGMTDGRREGGVGVPESLIVFLSATGAQRDGEAGRQARGRVAFRIFVPPGSHFHKN